MQCSPCNQWHCSGVVPCDALTVSSPASYLPHPSSPPSLQVLCLAGRAVNIFPLSALVNRFRSVRITFENQFIMWFSGKTHSLQQCTCMHLCPSVVSLPSLLVLLSAGLRGAVAFALVLMLADWEETIYKTLVTTTLIIVLFTIVVLGGSTLPILKVLHT